MNWVRWHRHIQKNVCMHTILIEPVKLHHSVLSAKTLPYHMMLVMTTRAYLCCGIRNMLNITLLLIVVLAPCVVIILR